MLPRQLFSKMDNRRPLRVERRPEYDSAASLVCNAYTAFFLWLVGFFTAAEAHAPAANAGGRAAHAANAGGQAAHAAHAGGDRLAPGGPEAAHAGEQQPSTSSANNTPAAHGAKALFTETNNDYVALTCSEAKYCREVVSSCLNALFVRIRAFFVGIGPLACLLISAFMQISLPVFILMHWLHNKRAGIDSSEDVSVNVKDVLQIFRATEVEQQESDHLLRVDYFDDYNNPSPGPADVRHVKVYFWELHWAKGLVATYVLFYVLLKDFQCICKLMIVALRLWAARPRRTIHLQRPIVVISVIMCLVYEAIVALVFVISLLVIGRSTSPRDVLLSGVGALFILEMDDLVVSMTEAEFQDRAKVTIIDNEADDLYMFLEGKKMFVYILIIWPVALFCVAEWALFVWSINR
ncbi:hypothetical protein PLESTB_000855800 [Pleodorina starrii]|uniref:Uncharacterized protein n=1 Tax=Pleodorina starrii TaxID=330485 RepID=A0A9W6BLG1_9CHLO|nr:hypothetical protein PLESTM_001438000 [Pleodorina starrii]GLC54362.1 hypothetical protein PLESTB_000855800 [Pleodorina starrii]GLC72013.1 hypothetical protein PLESTF_001195000 [Pleodorina starrii]